MLKLLAVTAHGAANWTLDHGAWPLALAVVAFTAWAHLVPPGALVK